MTRSSSCSALGQQRQVVHRRPPVRPARSTHGTRRRRCQTDRVSREGRRGNLPSSATTLIGRDAGAAGDRGAGPRPPAGDPERRRRGRQDAARPGGRRGARRRVPGRRVAGRAGAGRRPRRRARTRSPTPSGITPQGDAPVIDTVAEAVAGRRAADRDRQLRARPRRRPRRRSREILARSDDAPDPGDVAGAPAASPARRWCRSRRWPLDGGVTSDAVTLFVERAAHGPARVRHLRRADRDGRGRDLRDARRAAPGHRAGRGADGGDERDRGARPARRPVPAADRPGVRTRPPARRCGTRWRGPTTCWTTTSARCCARRRCSRAASTCRRCAPSPETSDDVEVLRLLDSLVRKSLVVAHHGSARTRYSLFETIRAFADEQLAQADRARGAARPACGALRGARRPRAGSGGTVPDGATRSTGCRPSWPTCGRRSGGASIAARSRWRPTSPPTRP